MDKYDREILEHLQADGRISVTALAERIAHIKQATFGGRRLVIFSGGGAKSNAEVLEEVRGIAAGGADGSIMGRNAFQRPHDEALTLLSDIINVYKAQR